MKFRIIFLIIVMIIVGGLDNYTELNDLAIVASISISKTEDEMYMISAQILNSKKEVSGSKSDGSSSKITVYEGKAKTVQESLRNMISESPKKLYLSHMQMIIIDEDVAKEGITASLDYFLRDIKSNKEVLVVVTEENTKSSDILKILTPIETNPTKNLEESIYSTYKYKGDSVKSYLSDVISDLIDDGIELVIESVKVEGYVEEGEKKDSLEDSSPKAKILVGDIAYFKNDKLMGYLSKEDNVSYNMFKNDLQNTIIQDELNGVEAAIEVIGFKSSLKPKFINNNFEVDLDVKFTANIAEITKKFKISTSEDIKSIEKQIEDIVKLRLETYVNNVKNIYNSDIIGFGKIFNKYLNKEYSKVKDIFYEEYFKNIKCNIKVKADLENEGGIVKEW